MQLLLYPFDKPSKHYIKHFNRNQLENPNLLPIVATTLGFKGAILGYGLNVYWQKGLTTNLVCFPNWGIGLIILPPWQPDSFLTDWTCTSHVLCYDQMFDQLVTNSVILNMNYFPLAKNNTDIGNRFKCKIKYIAVGEILLI